jgi:hypothetical protein
MYSERKDALPTGSSYLGGQGDEEEAGLVTAEAEKQEMPSFRSPRSLDTRQSTSLDYDANPVCRSTCWIINGVRPPGTRPPVALSWLLPKALRLSVLEDDLTWPSPLP